MGFFIFASVYILLSLFFSYFLYSNLIKFYIPKKVPRKGTTELVDLHKEFEVFARQDKLSFLSIFIGTLIFFWIRFIIDLILGIILMTILQLKLKKQKHKDMLTKEERASFKGIVNSMTTIFFYVSGMKVDHRKLDNQKVRDIYKKYFGDEYKFEFDKNYAGLIANHTSFVDTLLGMRYFACGYMSKLSIKNTPLVGPIATSLQTLFVDRGNLQSRSSILDQITRQQRNFYEGIDPTPILIYPEGTTTSNRNLLRFKKGAFYGNFPLKPVMIFANSDPDFHHGCGSSDVMINWLRGLTKLYTKISYYELPIMTPNEYMFEHYKNLGNEKWEIYSEVARKIYCEIGGFIPCENTLRDSTRYTTSMELGRYVEPEELKTQ